MRRIISCHQFWENMEAIRLFMKPYVSRYPPNYGDGASVSTMLYERHNGNNPYDNEQIKEDFNELYQQMNGMPLREMDKIICPVCKLCRDHERAGFIEEIKIGFCLPGELTEDHNLCKS